MVADIKFDFQIINQGVLRGRRKRVKRNSKARRIRRKGKKLTMISRMKCLTSQLRLRLSGHLVNLRPLCRYAQTQSFGYHLSSSNFEVQSNWVMGIIASALLKFHFEHTWYWTADDSATDRDQHNSNAANWYLKLPHTKNLNPWCFLMGFSEIEKYHLKVKSDFFLQFLTDKALTFTALQTLSRIFQLIRQQFMSGYHSQKQTLIGKSYQSFSLFIIFDRQ